MVLDRLGGFRIPGRNRYVARLRVVQRRELPDASPADCIHHTFTEAAVQVADQLRVGLGQLPERTMEELDSRDTRTRCRIRHLTGRAGFQRRLEPELAQLRLERTHTALAARPAAGVGAPFTPDAGGVGRLRADVLGERSEQTGEQRVGRRVEAEARRSRGEEVQMLRASDGPAVYRFHVDQAGVPQAIQVEADRVGMKAEAIGEILCRHRCGRARQLFVHGVPGLVAQRLEHCELVHDLTVAARGHIFKTEAVFIRMQRDPMSALDTPDPDDPGAPVHAPVAGPPPGVDDVRRILEGVIDPELHASIVDLGMVDDVTVDGGGGVRVTVALTTAGCPLRAQIKRDVESKVRGLRGVRDVKVEYGEMTQEQKTAAMQRARFNARENAAPTEVASTTRVLAIASGKGGVGKSSVTVNLAVALAARGLRVGVLDADIWGFSVPRMLGVDGRLGGADGKIAPHSITVPAGVGATGEIRVVSMGFLVDDEGTALMWRGLILTKALEQFLTDVRWGELDYLLIDMPPGTGDIQMGLARMLPQAEMLVVTTPAVAAQKVAVRVADMARRSYMKVVGVVENMSEFVAPDGSRHAIFGSGGGAQLAAEIDAPLVARIPIEAAVGAGGDTGSPVALADPASAAGAAFHELAERVATDLLPPIEMSSCTARMLDLVENVGGSAT